MLFEAAADGGGPDPRRQARRELYDRIDGAATVEVSAPAPGAEPADCETADTSATAGPAQFWAASADGSLVYFTSKAALTKESYTGAEEAAGGEDPGNDLYRYDVETGTLTDLTADSPETRTARSVARRGRRSEDGSYVYFVAEGDSARRTRQSGQARTSTCGTRRPQASGTVAFIATLASAERAKKQENIEAIGSRAAFEYHSDVADWTSRPTASQAYVTPDGRHLAFMSVEPLTGYDNEDQATGVADHEVFEYSAETGQLACASCDPSGARPLGSAFIGARLSERASTPFHQPRSLSDDGSRLFFTSPDPLVPASRAAATKVFEYEDGAVAARSPARESGGDAVFLDASASGDDVFFATRERLAPTDTDELVDVYDARVDGGLPRQPPGADVVSRAAPARSRSTRRRRSPRPLRRRSPAPGTSRPPARLREPTRKQLLARALARCRKLRSTASGARPASDAAERTLRAQSQTRAVAAPCRQRSRPRR